MKTTVRRQCACGKPAICGAYTMRDIRDEPVLVFCGDCTPYLADLPPSAPYLGALPSTVGRAGPEAGEGGP